METSRLGDEPWYYSTCRLENVVGITCCIDTVRNYQPIIGMLIEYAEGHRECVGHYRLDKAAEPFKRDLEDHEGELRIGMSRNQLGKPYVARVGPWGDVDSDTSTLQWLDFPWRGRLEWWASPRRGVELCYSNEASRT